MPGMRTKGRVEHVRLKPGRNYWWRVEDAEDLYSLKGDPQIKLILKVGDRDGTVKMFESLTFNENAFFRIELFMKSAGVYPGDGVDVEFAAADCIGLQGGCTVRDEESKKDGKAYSRIDKWLEANAQNPLRTWIDRARAADDSPPPGAGYALRPEDDHSYNDAGPVGDDIPF